MPRLRWTTLSAIAVIAGAGVTAGAVAWVHQQGMTLLDQLAADEAATAAATVTRSIDTHIRDAQTALDRTLRAAHNTNPADLCITLHIAAPSTATAVLGSTKDILCRAGPPDRSADVISWALGMGTSLVEPGATTTVRFSPAPLDGLVVAATRHAELRILHWIPQDPLLLNLSGRLGSRAIAMAFTPSGASRPQVAYDLADRDNSPQRPPGGFRIPNGRSIGPLGIDAFWASATTASGNETVHIGIDPQPYLRERSTIGSNLVLVAAPLGGAALFGILGSLAWTCRSLRKLRAAVDGATGGSLPTTLPASGPKEARDLSAALEQLAAAQDATDRSDRQIRAEEQARLVTILDIDVADQLDRVVGSLRTGRTVDHHRDDLHAINTKLRTLISLLRPPGGDHGCIGSVLSAVVAQHPGWTFHGTPGLNVDVAIGGFLSGLTAELCQLNPTGRITLVDENDRLRLRVEGLNVPPPHRWHSSAASLGGAIQFDNSQLMVCLPLRIEPAPPAQTEPVGT